jgi:hypothetical protein
MKKNNSYLADDEIDLGDLIRTLWREKILILSISIICGLLGYLYALLNLNQKFIVEITLNDPPSQLFEPYSGLTFEPHSGLTEINPNNKNNKNSSIAGQFISDFKLKLLSLDNLESFVEESRDLDNFKAYIKSNNITVKKYFKDQLSEAKEKNIIIPNKYFLNLKEKILEGDIFLNNYVEFTKKKNITEFKKNLKITIENTSSLYEQAFETAKLINLENPILKSPNNQAQVINEPEALFYKGTKVLGQNIIYFKRLLQKLESDQFNYNSILDKAIITPIVTMYSYFYFLIYLFIGFFLSCIIIFFKSALKNK